MSEIRLTRRAHAVGMAVASLVMVVAFMAAASQTNINGVTITAALVYAVAAMALGVETVAFTNSRTPAKQVYNSTDR